MNIKRIPSEYYLKILFILFLFIYSINSTAQEKKTEYKESSSNNNEILSIKKLKISGYIQGQFQYGEKDASLKVGSENENKEKPFNRFGVRRGRIKFAYEEGIASGVFQLDLTEKGIGFKDVYININDPWLKTNALRAGVFDRPFGYEIRYSSSMRESPERSTVFQKLFPDERDLGAMLVLEPGRESVFNIIKLEAGLFAGNGIKKEIDNRKDFIGHLALNQQINNNFRYSVGVSYYNGGVYQGNDSIYKMQDKEFMLYTDNNKGKFAKREYIGFDAQISLTTVIGISQLRGEYLFGRQPGSENSSDSPNSNNLPTHKTFIRNFSGGYVQFIQDIGLLPVSFIIKYDWYDPNTKIYGNSIGLNGTGKTDVFQNTLGIGVLWNIYKSIRLQAYYEFNNYEHTENISELNNIKSDVFTLRLQYKF